MDIKQLHYFCTIAKEGQITRAAKKLHMAQPPLSQQLKQLEVELGVKLMERQGRNMELTSAGEILYKKATRLLAELEDTKSEVKETGDGLRGILSIGSVKTCFSYLPEKIRYFRETYPNVTFHLREGDTYFVSELLRNRVIEVAVIRLPLDTDDFSMIQLPSEPYVAVIPQKWEHQFRNTTSIEMKELQNLPLLLLHRINGTGQYEMILDECKRHGFKPHVVCECPDAAMLLSLVDAGVGATLVPKSTLLSLHTTNTVTLELQNSKIQSESAVIWLKDRYLSKSAQHFIDTFREHSTIKE
ncbi:LysR family transcriptional regulator [Bacillus carboniphilus]|uniref:LysR family transcriptional regulator n=1 Tax=Bacillus carboniphilus TaxID=86663 RepID=A0ABN0W9V0_9BACI